jgi:hypothetical protein
LLYEVLRGKIDHFDLVRLIDDRIGHGFTHTDAGDASHHVVEAFQMLDVQRGVDIDARRKQLLNIQITFGMAASFGIRVRKFVHEYERGPAGKNGVEIHLVDHAAAIFHLAPRNDLEAIQKGQGLGAAMRLHNADDHINMLASLALRDRQHLERLADAGCSAEEDLEFSMSLLAAESKQGIRRWASVAIDQKYALCRICIKPCRARPAPGSSLAR